MENIKIFFKKKNIDFFFPVSFILTIVPLIVRMKPVESEQAVINLFGKKNASSDLFSQRKAFFLMIFCIILISISIVFFKKIFEKKDKVINSILIASVIFLVFTFLSAIFSTYKQTALWGIFDRSEGFVTISCYIVLLIYSIYTFKTKNDYKYLLIPILILVFINSFLGLFQYIGQDLIKTKLGTVLVVPSEHITPGMKLSSLYEAGKLYGTLFHYDYVGSFVAIVLPILFCLAIYEFEDIMLKISLSIGTLLSIWLLFGSTSRAGIIGVLIATLMGIVVFWKLVNKKWKPIAICIVSLLVIATGFNFATKGAIFERLPALASDALSIFKDTSNLDYRDYTPVRDIKYTDKDAQVLLQNDTLKISYENNAFVLRNSKDEIIPYVNSGKIYTISNDAFKNLTFMIAAIDNTSKKADGFLLYINNQPTFMFGLKQDNSIHLLAQGTRKDLNLEYPETFGFKGKEKLGSARGYIWSRSIPMLKNDLILGSGPDTFALTFPQNDLIGKYYAYDTPNMIVDKPHNLFLQIGLNNGIIALLAFLAIMVIYLVDSIKLYALRKDYHKPQVLGAAISLGIVGYLFSGFFNDSVVSVAPVFWIVLGAGISVNYMNRTELKNSLKK